MFARAAGSGCVRPSGGERVCSPERRGAGARSAARRTIGAWTPTATPTRCGPSASATGCTPWASRPPARSTTPEWSSRSARPRGSTAACSSPIAIRPGRRIRAGPSTMCGRSSWAPAPTRRRAPPSLRPTGRASPGTPQVTTTRPCVPRSRRSRRDCATTDGALAFCSTTTPWWTVLRRCEPDSAGSARTPTSCCRGSGATSSSDRS